LFAVNTEDPAVEMLLLTRAADGTYRPLRYRLTGPPEPL
jgi:hypothetical protein